MLINLQYQFYHLELWKDFLFNTRFILPTFKYLEHEGLKLRGLMKNTILICRFSWILILLSALVFACTYRISGIFCMLEISDTRSKTKMHET